MLLKARGTGAKRLSRGDYQDLGLEVDDDDDSLQTRALELVHDDPTDS